MLKGHVKVELTDVNTGKKQVVEGSNLITPAIEMLWMRQLNGHDYNAIDMRTLGNSALGGIMLFDNDLDTTVPDLMEFPNYVHFVGSAIQVSNNVNSLCGSLNSIESSSTEHSYTNVWDFSTSQCNGTIKSLALTHSGVQSTNGSKLSPYNISYTTQLSGHSNEWYIGVWNDCVYKLQLENNIFNLYKAPMHTNKLGVRTLIATSWTFVKSATNETGLNTASGGYYTYCYYDPTDGYAYLYTSYPTQCVTSTTFTYAKIRISDESLDQVAAVTVSCPDCSFGYYHANASMIIEHHKAYLYKSDQTKVYIVDLDNPTNIIEVSKPNTVNFSLGWRRLAPGVICVDGADNGCNWVIYEDGTNIADLYNTDSVSVCNSIFTTEHRIASNYLGSIYNLPSAIQKTASQTMKITYTISDATEASIQTQPEDQSVSSGSIATFTIALLNGTGSTYQWWYYNVTDKRWRACDEATATTDTLSVTATTAMNGRRYKCIATNTDGTKLESAIVFLTVS